MSKKGKDDRYKKIYSIVEKHDPMGIAFCAKDEYEPEVKDICKVLEEYGTIKKVEELFLIVRSVFNKWFRFDLINDETTNKITNDIWKELFL